MYPPPCVPANSVKAICASIRDGGRFAKTDVCKRLETCIFQGVGRVVAFRLQMPALHRLPQLYRKGPYTEKINIKCFIQANDEEVAIFRDLLRQVSIATVLAVSSTDFVDTLSPDETYLSFSQNYSSYDQLSQSVYDTLSEVISDFPAP